MILASFKKKMADCDVNHVTCICILVLDNYCINVLMCQIIDSICHKC